MVWAIVGRDAPIGNYGRSASGLIRVVYDANVYIRYKMTRTQIYLTETQRRALRIRAIGTGRAQSELIREAVDEYLERHARSRRRVVLKGTAGLWAERGDIDELVSARASMDRDFVE